MSQRTTSAAVIDLLVSGKQYDSVATPSLDPFIATATALTDLVEAADADDELNATVLERIEAYLAAHFYAHADQLYQERNTGKAGAVFQGKTGMVLLSTQYGQTACLLDVTGYLARKNKEAEGAGRRKASMSWLGKPPSEQIDYVDRD